MISAFKILDIYSKKYIGILYKMEKGDIVYLNHPRFGIYKGEYERKAGVSQGVIKITDALQTKGVKLPIGKLQKAGDDFIVKDKPALKEKKKKKEPPPPFNDNKKEKLQSIVGNKIDDSNESLSSEQSLYVGSGGYQSTNTKGIKNRWKLDIFNPIDGSTEKTLYFASLTELASKVPMFKYDTWRNLALGRGKRYDRFVKLTKDPKFKKTNWNSNTTN